MQGSAHSSAILPFLQCAYYATYLQAINLRLLTALRAALPAKRVANTVLSGPAERAVISGQLCLPFLAWGTRLDIVSWTRSCSKGYRGNELLWRRSCRGCREPRRTAKMSSRCAEALSEPSPTLWM